ncbi:hypothetical protein B0H10DRAFT_1946396 [Mycena sp. CBHHK59/15]|nr:hypothetical protein B0H10DRAFT_1946396 [Mycena sp. CBHHK59/15]
MPVSQDKMVKLLTRVYQPFCVGEQEGQPHHSMSTQKMVVLYFVFALGALVNLSLSPYSSEADHYVDLGSGTVLVGLVFCSWRPAVHHGWSLVPDISGFQYYANNCESFGSKLPPKEALFWETYSIETIYCFPDYQNGYQEFHRLSSAVHTMMLNVGAVFKAAVGDFASYRNLITIIQIIVGTIATRYLNLKMALHTILELYTAVDLIEKGAVSSAAGNLSTTSRQVYSQYSGHSLTPPPTADRDTEEELEIFAGYTRVVANKVLTRGIHKEPSMSASQAMSSDSFPPVAGPSAWQSDLEVDVLLDFNPSIIEYFTLPTPASTNTFRNVDWTSLLQYGMNPSEDTGFFFTFPPNSSASDFNNSQIYFVLLIDSGMGLIYEKSSSSSDLECKLGYLYPSYGPIWFGARKEVRNIPDYA